MKGKAILLVTALVVVGVTIGIYNVAFDELTSPLKLAMAVVCLSELAIISTLGLIPAVNYKNGATGIMVDVYAFLMICWCLAYPLFDTDKTFHIGLLVISAIMLGLIGFATFGSHESDKLNQITEATISQKRDYKQVLASMWLSMQTTIEDDDTRKAVRVLVERIQALPANRFPNQTIEGGMKEVAAMSRALSNPDAKERVQARLQNKVVELTNYIKTL